ncbi:MAG: hypothetical protein KJ011_18770 [Burkholderiaceae bacterium]|nr:hypothetical protein [Burkholderiaceae bacterium]
MSRRTSPAGAVAAAAVCATLTACVVIDREGAAFHGPVVIEHPGYPPYWPAPVAASGPCPLLDGRFELHDLDDRRPLSLLHWTQPWAPAPAGATHVDLAGPRGGGLTVRWLGADATVLLQRTLHEDVDFRCVAGWLQVPLAAPALPGVVATRHARLGRNVRGDLVVAQTEAGGGLGFLVVPLYGSFKDWHAYRQAMPAPTGATRDGTP